MRRSGAKKQRGLAPGEIDINLICATLRALWRKRKLGRVTGKLVCELHWKDGELRGAEFIEGVKLNPPQQEDLFP